MDTYTLEIDPDPNLVPTARMFAATVARQLGAPEDSVLDLKIAVSEACSNSVQAHLSQLITTPITVRIEETGSALVYEIEDAGEGIAELPGEPPEVFQKAIAGIRDGQDGAEHGLGLALIKALFPQVEFLPHGSGTVVRFRLGL